MGECFEDEINVLFESDSKEMPIYSYKKYGKLLRIESSIIEKYKKEKRPYYNIDCIYYYYIHNNRVIKNVFKDIFIRIFQIGILIILIKIFNFDSAIKSKFMVKMVKIILFIFQTIVSVVELVEYYRKFMMFYTGYVYFKYILKIKPNHGFKKILKNIIHIEKKINNIDLTEEEIRRMLLRKYYFYRKFVTNSVFKNVFYKNIFYTKYFKNIVQILVSKNEMSKSRTDKIDIHYLAILKKRFILFSFILLVISPVILIYNFIFYFVKILRKTLNNSNYLIDKKLICKFEEKESYNQKLYHEKKNKLKRKKIIYKKWVNQRYEYKYECLYYFVSNFLQLFVIFYMYDLIRCLFLYINEFHPNVNKQTAIFGNYISDRLLLRFLFLILTIFARNRLKNLYEKQKINKYSKKSKRFDSSKYMFRFNLVILFVELIAPIIVPLLMLIIFLKKEQYNAFLQEYLNYTYKANINNK
ncbi:hypothetical protein CWI36_0278p0030 [Hamiltosporidium magnivora]|uniref:Uncharacterized protein n=1 Tax=Hamiltosporidium magnivora TaxID=148818 RepID=A0A4Q9LH87_9MICR|nr:hypothetical protein CWI36_0278p0030 [Hamiltosporidium magnivora]